jgi:hypothetical protein
VPRPVAPLLGDRPMFRNSVPLLILPFALYNIVMFLLPDFSWKNEIWHVYMISG